MLQGQTEGILLLLQKLVSLTFKNYPPPLAIELARLVSVAGQAMTTVLKKAGIDIGRINYQDNGNWTVFKAEGSKLHVHIYGRAKDAKIQKYGQALNFPHKAEYPEFYKDNEPLHEEDIIQIKKEIERLLTEEKYADSAWGL